MVYLYYILLHFSFYKIFTFWWYIISKKRRKVVCPAPMLKKGWIKKWVPCSEKLQQKKGISSTSKVSSSFNNGKKLEGFWLHGVVSSVQISAKQTAYIEPIRPKPKTSVTNEDNQWDARNNNIQHSIKSKSIWIHKVLKVKENSTTPIAC